MPETSPFNFGFLEQFGVTIQRFQKGDILIRKGDVGNAMLLILEGQLTVLVDGRAAETVGLHGIVGEMALIDTSPRSATVRALSAGEAAVIDRATFLDLVREVPAFSLYVMQALARRVRQMNA